MIRRNTASDLVKKLKIISSALIDLDNYTDARFKDQVRSINQYFESTQLLLDNLAHISEAQINKRNKDIRIVYTQSSAACKNHFDQIIKSLQFHDIIQQRLLHIIQLNDWVLGELADYQARESEIQLTYSPLINEIIRLYLGQLGLIKTEYHHSFEGIKSNLFGLSKEISRVKEAAWDFSGSSFFTEKQVMDLPDYIQAACHFEREIFYKVLNIDSEAAFIDEAVDIVKNANEYIQKGIVNNQSFVSGESEILKVIPKINQIFTMESERELWQNILCDAGFTAVLKGMKKEDLQGNDIDLF